METQPSLLPLPTHAVGLRGSDRPTQASLRGIDALSAGWMQIEFLFLDGTPLSLGPGTAAVERQRPPLLAEQSVPPHSPPERSYF